jgi:hypothetical protein
MSRRIVGVGVALLAGALVLPLHGQGPGRGRGAPVTLPEGPGKASVEAACSRCHSLGQIAGSGGFTRDG